MLQDMYRYVIYNTYSLFQGRMRIFLIDGLPSCPHLAATTHLAFFPTSHSSGRTSGCLATINLHRHSHLPHPTIPYFLHPPTEFLGTRHRHFFRHCQQNSWSLKPSPFQSRCIFLCLTTSHRILSWIHSKEKRVLPEYSSDLNAGDLGHCFVNCYVCPRHVLSSCNWSNSPLQPWWLSICRMLDVRCSY